MITILVHNSLVYFSLNLSYISCCFYRRCLASRNAAACRARVMRHKYTFFFFRKIYLISGVRPIRECGLYAGQYGSLYHRYQHH